jgi:hypothetical protein
METPNAACAFTKTANNGNALKTTGSSIVDYFMLFVRDLDIDVSNKYLEKCWEEDPKKTVAIIFNGRDRLSGKKEKKIANDAMLWLRKNKFNTYANNIKNYIEKYIERVKKKLSKQYKKKQYKLKLSKFDNRIVFKCKLTRKRNSRITWYLFFRKKRFKKFNVNLRRHKRSYEKIIPIYRN